MFWCVKLQNRNLDLAVIFRLCLGTAVCMSAVVAKTEGHEVMQNCGADSINWLAVRLMKGESIATF